MRRWKNVGLAAVLGLAVAAGFGCGSSAGGGGDAGDDGDQAGDGDGGGLCTVDGDCGDGRCVDGVCRPAGYCEDSRDCPIGSLCNLITHQCVAAECLGDLDCAAGERCTDGSCVPLCDGVDCAPGERCVPETGLCERLRCTVGSAVCAADEDCRQGLYCDPVSRGCTECPTGFFCNFHECFALQAECQVHSDCAVDERCNPVSQRCEPYPETCAADLDCKPRYCNLYTHTCQVEPFTGNCTSDAECQAAYGGGYYCHPRLFSCVLPLGPGECYDSQDCGDPGLVCNPKDNSCVPQGTICMTDADCDPGYICLSDTCVFQCTTACETDAECLNGFACRNGCCVQGSTCTDDYDCPAGQVCLQGWCSPACTTDDAYEDNDSSAAPAALTGLVPNGAVEFPGLVVCDGDDDWFAITVPADQKLRVRVEFANSLGDIDIDLYDDIGWLDSSSSGSNDYEEVSADEQAVDTTYYLEVHLYSGATNTYLVRVTLEAVVDPCSYADPFEENDAAAQATVLPVPALGQFQEWLTLTVCGADVDWYRVDAPAGARLELRVQFDHYAGNLQLAAYTDPAAAPIATSTTTDDEESIFVQPLADTTYYFRVYGQSNASNTYGLRLSQGAPECVGDDAFEPNDTTQQAVVMNLPMPGPDVYSGLVCCMDNEDWYAFPLQARDSMIVDVAFTNSLGDIEVYLYSPSGTTVDSSTSSSDVESVEVSGAAAGLYKLKVYHYSYDDYLTNPYDMTITYYPEGIDPTCQDDPLEPNDTSQTATPLGLSLADAAVCGGDLDWYAIPVLAGEWVRVLVDYTPAGSHHLAVALYGANGTTQLDSDTGSASHRALEVTTHATADTTLYLKASIGSAVPSDRATYQVLVVRSVVDCQDGGREPNNSAAAASALAAGDYTGLAVCRATPADQDWYRISLTAWERLHVAADSNPADGDLGLTLYQENGTSVVDTSDTSGAREQVDSPRVASPTVYLARVLNRTGTNPVDLAYRLAAWVDPPPDCQDDLLEENDSAQAAAALGAGLQDAVLCHIDPDWYAVEVPARYRLLATASYDPAVAGLELRAYQPDGTTLIASSLTHAGAEVIDQRLAATTTVLLQASMYQPTDAKRLPYALDVVLEAPQECTDDALEPNNDLAGASPLAAPGTADLVLCPADADVHALAVTRGTRASFSLVNLGGQGDADLYLLDAQGAVLRSSVLSGTATETIANVDSLYDQTYYLRVVPKDLLSDVIVDYRLDVVLDAFTPCDDDALEPNDTAATASPLDGQAWLPVLDQWELELSGLYACRTGPPDWYSFPLLAGQHLSVSVGFPTGRNANVYLYGPDGTTLLDSSAGTANPEVVDLGAFGAAADGVYYLKVIAYNSAGNDFAYTMSLVTDTAFICRSSPFDPFEPNASPAEALVGSHLPPGASAYLTLCGAEDDYYAIDALAGQTVTATATFNLATDIDLYLLDADGLTLLDASEGVTGTEQVTATLAQDGPVYLLAYFNKHNPTWVAPYDLHLDVSGP